MGSGFVSEDISEFETLKESVMDYVISFCSCFCIKNCSGNCCNWSRYKLHADDDTIGLFTERGIPVVGLDDCMMKDGTSSTGISDDLREQGSLSFITKTFAFRGPNKSFMLRTRDGSEVKDPSMVRLTHGDDSGNIYLLYSPGNLYKCPLFSEEGGCGIHNDTLRPKECRMYPISVMEADEQIVCGFDYRYMDDCGLVHNERFLSGLEKVVQGKAVLNWKD